MQGAAYQAYMHDLKSKLYDTQRFNDLKTYKHMVKVGIIGDGNDSTISHSAKETCEDFRKLHNITIDEHIKILYDLGWTAEEYSKGKKRVKSRAEKIFGWYDSTLGKITSIATN